MTARVSCRKSKRCGGETCRDERAEGTDVGAKMFGQRERAEAGTKSHIFVQLPQREKGSACAEPFMSLVGRTGFEPVTNGLKVRWCGIHETLAR